MKKIFLQEKIGNPALFTGRKKELNNLLKWADEIKLEFSKSKAVISRRKTGKSALMLEYESIWSYSASPIYKKDIQVDIFAKASNDNYSLIGEVKNRKAKFSLKEAKEFLSKAMEVKKMENVNKALIFIFSSSGFFQNTIQFLKENKIAWSSDKKFLE